MMAQGRGRWAVSQKGKNDPHFLRTKSCGVPQQLNLSLCTAVPFLFVRRLEATHSAFLREYKIKMDGQLRRYNHSCFSFSKKATSLLNDPFSLALTSMFPLRTVRNAVHVVHALSRFVGFAGRQSVHQWSLSSPLLYFPGHSRSLCQDDHMTHVAFVLQESAVTITMFIKTTQL